LKLIPLSGSVPAVPVMIAWKKQNLTEPAREFIAAARAAAKSSLAAET
jgi:hypothetical protein